MVTARTRHASYTLLLRYHPILQNNGEVKEWLFLIRQDDGFSLIEDFFLKNRYVFRQNGTMYVSLSQFRPDISLDA